MADHKTMMARRERKLRRETELRRLNDSFTAEILENDDGKETKD
jgi:hypothetical protein